MKQLLALIALSTFAFFASVSLASEGTGVGNGVVSPQDDPTPLCNAQGGPCQTNADCCSSSCVTSSHTCA